MDDISQIVEFARRRLSTNRFLRGVHLGLVAVATLGLMLVLLAKSSPAIVLPWTWVFVAAGTVLVAAGIAAMRVGRMGGLSLAVLVDERLGLKERLSTALAVRERGDAFARAAVADAVTLAKDARTRESLRRNFPLQAPSNSWIGLAIAAVATVLWFVLPQGDLFRRDAVSQTELAVAKKQSDEAISKVVDTIKQNDRLAEALGKKVESPATNGLDPAKELTKTPEEAKLEAMKKLAEMQKALDTVLKGKEAQELKALKQQLADLSPPSGPTEELGTALKEGDFTKAKEAMDKLQKSMEGKSDAEKKELEEKLGDMANQIAKLAENQRSLQNALEKAGLDSQLANNPEALKQALANAKNLTEAQKQSIAQAAAAQQAASEQMKGMSQAMKQAAAQMCQGGQNGGQKAGQKNGQQGQQGQGQNQQNSPAGDGQGGGQMSDMLDGMEAMQQMMNAAEAAANEAQQACQGMGQGMGQMAGNCNSNSDSNNVGQKQGWQGGRGRASGGSGAQWMPTPTGTKIQKEKVQSSQGEIIAKQLIEGKTVAGQSNVQVENVITEIARSMESGVTEDQVPKALEDLHKNYFGTLKRKLEAQRDPNAHGASPPAPKSADGASSSGK